MDLDCKEIAVLSPLDPHVNHGIRLRLTPIRVFLSAYLQLCLKGSLARWCGLLKCEGVTLELEAEAVA